MTGRFYGITFSNNEMFNIGTVGSDGGSFIRLQQDFGGARILYENISFIGNTMRDQNSASSTWYAVDMSGRGTDITMSGNSLDGVTGVGGFRVGEVNNSVVNLVMNSNKINVTNAASNVRAVFLSGVSNSTFLGNNINGHTTGTTYGFYIEGNSSDNSIVNNVSHNTFASLDNGIAEIANGNTPDANQIFDNNYNTVTTKVTKLGASTMVKGQDVGNFGFGLGNPSAFFHISPLAQGGGPNSSAGASFRLGTLTFTDTTTAGSGTATGYVANSFAAPTLAATNASVTTTDASTLYVSGGPIKGTNNTVTNAHALYVAAGNVGAQTNSYGLTVNTQTGATTNYAAQFLGGQTRFGGALVPTANDGAALGVSGTAFSDAFFASGAVINFNAGDVTATHSADALTFAGGNYTFNGNVGIGIAPTALFTLSGDASNIYVGNFYLMDNTGTGAGSGARMALGGIYTGTTQVAYGTIAGLKLNGTDGNHSGYLAFSTRANGGTMDEHLRLDQLGHLISLGSAPAASSCGTSPSVTATSTDNAGKVTIGSGATTSCTVTFAAAYASAPACTVSGDNTAVTYIATTTASVLTIISSADMASDVISYICLGHT